MTSDLDLWERELSNFKRVWTPTIQLEFWLLAVVIAIGLVVGWVIGWIV